MSLSRWNIYCVTEGAYQEINSVNPPTACPNNNTHEVDLDRVEEKQKYNQLVQIQEENVVGLTGGNFNGHTRSLIVGEGETASDVFVYPITVSILVGKYFCERNNRGDNFVINIAPNTIVGGIMENVATNDTVIKVSDTVPIYATKGCYITLFDGAKSSNEVQVVDVNTTSFPKTITVSSGINTSFFWYSPTYVRMTIRMTGPEYVLAGPTHYVLGSGKIGASTMPANIPIQILYTNNSVGYIVAKLMGDIEPGQTEIEVGDSFFSLPYLVEQFDYIEIVDEENNVKSNELKYMTFNLGKSPKTITLAEPGIDRAFSHTSGQVFIRRTGRKDVNYEIELLY